MTDNKVTRRFEMDCAEEARRASLITEWEVAGDGSQKLVAVQCDNPRLASLEPHDCSWSCWRRVEELAARDQG